MHRQTCRPRAIVAAACVAVAAPGALANDSVKTAIADENNWAIWGGNYEGQRYSTLDSINKDNVKDLRVAWTFSTGVLRGHEGGPMVIGDTLYVHTPFPNKVFSIDLATRTINWSYVPKQDPDTIPVMCCDTVARGLAYADGKIFLQQADTTLVALDALPESGGRLGLRASNKEDGAGVLIEVADDGSGAESDLLDPRLRP